MPMRQRDGRSQRRRCKAKHMGVGQACAMSHARHSPCSVPWAFETWLASGKLSVIHPRCNSPPTPGQPRAVWAAPQGTLTASAEHATCAPAPGWSPRQRGCSVELLCAAATTVARPSCSTRLAGWRPLHTAAGAADTAAARRAAPTDASLCVAGRVAAVPVAPTCLRFVSQFPELRKRLRGHGQLVRGGPTAEQGKGKCSSRALRLLFHLPSTARVRRRAERPREGRRSASARAPSPKKRRATG